MSNTSTATQEFDFWEFVNCARCHLSFATEAGTPAIPFWLTECGHIVCNNHLHPDQSCAQCGAQGIQLMPLQREMEAPMSDWFRPVTTTFDSVAFAARFQMETLASLARHYKEKCTQYRSLLERLKNEYRALKKTNEDLRLENDQLRRYAEYGESIPADVPNLNRKRQIVDRHRHPNGARTNSSPQSIVNPIGPERLTLPPDHRPAFTPHGASRSDDLPIESFQTNSEQPQYMERPGSSRFIQQYAYMPPQTTQTQAVSTQTLSHSQLASTRRAVSRRAPQDPLSSAATHTAAMLPPVQVGHDSSARLQNRVSTTSSGTGNIQMPPPPTPKRHQLDAFRSPATPLHQVGVSNNSRRFVPSTPSRSASVTKSGVPEQYPMQQRDARFLPPAQPTSRSGSSVQPIGTGTGGHLSRTPSMAVSGSQRLPFIPST